MAAWAGLGQAATVAQLVGVDVGGLISMIVQAALTARHNKRECEQLARRVLMIAQLLPHLQDPEVMRRPEVRRPLAGLDDTLREAHQLVVSCQERSAAYQLVMAGRLADKFSDVQSRIDSYLIVFPMISHIVVTRRLDRLCNVLLPDDTTQYSQRLEFAEVAQEVPLALGDGAKEFAFAEIMAATNNFSRDTVVGSGGFGDVYKGRLHDGREVAIKRLINHWAQYAKEAFATELAVLSSSSLRHRHIVRLFGWCVRKEKRLLLSFRKKEEERLLVYEYMKNGTLLEQLRNHDSSSSSPVVASWKTRVEVLLGVSRAIEHLHCHAVPSVIHRDIKSSNILFDESWVPHVSDFGESITWHKTNEEEDQGIECHVMGTIGYIDPEYLLTGYLKPTSDVYNFGVVMLEVLTGKQPSAANWLEEGDKAGSHGLTGFVCFMLPIIEAGDLGKVLDRRPGSEPTPRQLQALELVAHTAALCVRLQGKDRPAILDVVANLETAVELICRQEPADSVDDKSRPHDTSAPLAGSQNQSQESTGAAQEEEEAWVPDGAEELPTSLVVEVAAATSKDFAVDGTTGLVVVGHATVYKAGLEVAMKRMEKELRDAEKVFRSFLSRLGLRRRHRHALHLVSWCMGVLIIALFLAFALPQPSIVPLFSFNSWTCML